jgi:TrmH family RNA methyltransferase
MLITSVHNPQVKRLLSLRDRRGREVEGQMLIEGGEEVALALDAGVSLVAAWLCPTLPRFAKQSTLRQRLVTAGVPITEVSENVFARLAYQENPDGWLAVAPALRPDLASLNLPPGPLVLVCEAIEKPGNLGAMLRTADAAGAHALIVCDATTDVNNPNVVRASRGTVFSVPLAVATTEAAVAWLKSRSIQILAATPSATRSYTDVDLRGPVAIAVGAEDTGLSDGFLAQADLAVRIPMTGRVNSLNVSASAALLLYEAVRQRG